MLHERAHGGSVAALRGRTAMAPLGYSIPAFPWYIDQTIGGAVATGSHGSTLRFGSVSSQARPPHPSPCMWRLRGGQERAWNVQLRNVGTWERLQQSDISNMVSVHVLQSATCASSHRPHATSTLTPFTAGNTFFCIAHAQQ